MIERSLRKEIDRLKRDVETADAEIERLRALVLDASNGLEFHGHQVDASAIRSQLYDRAQARRE